MTPHQRRRALPILSPAICREAPRGGAPPLAPGGVRGWG
eukprot:CAMPEP_0182528172 /NCGR_PEP_ID=MMETSP1323-20130603/4343_1 /TAXON_ID=236787 /ORGANISM="Florenciella parvula, Strain RCC1693" /LENGTH=38 /DNA_ID= /DNA_START= /DNA_END= /DNA_ORIENTATION=